MSSRSRLTETFVKTLSAMAAGAIVAVFLWILFDIVSHGWRQISWSYLMGDPERAGRAGGIAPILVGTLYLMMVSLAFSVPIGVGAALYLAEFASPEERFARFVRRSLDILAGVPSIVFGLFGYLVFCQALKMGWSLLSGGLTLGCMILPMLIRATEEGLRAAPENFRMGAAALGVSRSAVLWKILIPAAAPGLRVGLVLGLGRALAETAAVMFTSGASIRMPESVMASARSLAYHIYILAIEVPGGQAMAYSAALILVAVLLGLNLGSHWMIRRFVHKRIFIH